MVFEASEGTGKVASRESLCHLDLSLNLQHPCKPVQSRRGCLLAQCQGWGRDSSSLKLIGTHMVGREDRVL